MKFTVRSVKTAPPGDHRDPSMRGLVLRVSPTGHRSFYLVYRVGRRRRWFSLGAFPAPGPSPLAPIFDAYQKAILARREGLDPALELRRRPASSGNMTVTDLAATYLERWSKPRKRSWREDERILRTKVLPALGGTPIHRVARIDLIDLVNDLVAGGMGAGANRVLAITRRMFNWAVEQGLLEHSPAHRIRPPAPERRRSRILSDAEIASLWPRRSGVPMSLGILLLLRLALLSAARMGELTRMRWDDLDLERRLWAIPDERTKTGEGRVVAFSPPAVEILEELRGQAVSEWVFFSGRRGGPVLVSSVSAAVRRVDWAMPRWTPHDLRRTAATNLRALGASREVVKRILGHRDRSVTAIYDRYTMLPEIRAALDAWGAKIAALTGDQAPICTSRPAFSGQIVH